MNINTKLAVSVHILALLALEERHRVTSELLARSVHTNPVVIRKLMGSLKKAGLVQVRPGVGGAALCKAPRHISLLQVYLAVHGEEEALFPLHPSPSARCYVGRTIKEALSAPFSAAQLALEESLEKTSIADIAGYIRRHSQPDTHNTQKSEERFMKQIFEPVTVGKVPLKNRLLRSATFEAGGGDSNGNITPFTASLYHSLAKGGVGAIITGMYGISPQGQSREDSIKLFADGFKERFSAIAAAVHAEGCKIIVQINHTGVKSFQKERVPQGPSARQVSETVSAREMSKEDIAQAVTDFGAGAKICKESGADAVQIHAAHGYLLSQFLSPYYNKRSDEYGGGIENRARLLLEVYDEVRRQVGADYPVWAKLNASDLQDEGLTAEESRWVAKQLDERGIDAIELSSGLGNDRYTTPARRVHGEEEEAYFSEEALANALALRCSIISVGGYRTPAVMEDVLNKGEIAAVSLCRPLLREPGLPARWQAGNLEKATCLSCNKCFRPGGSLRCQVDFPTE